jgi:arylsulfatase A-like enzyme
MAHPHSKGSAENKRKIFILVVASLLAVLLWLALAGTDRPAVSLAEQKPNIIFVIIEDTSKRDIGIYGDRGVKSPNIDRLANTGIRFENVFVTAPSCTPSHTSIATGLYPHEHKASRIGVDLDESFVVFPELLKKQGYWTALAGKWDSGRFHRKRFDVMYQTGDWTLDLTLKALAERPVDKPFFIWASDFGPHRQVYDPPSKQVHNSDEIRLPDYFYDTPAARKEFAQYLDQISRIDVLLGQIESELERQQVRDNTRSIFLSDHGRPFYRAKASLYDSGTNIPFIVNWPAARLQPSVSNALISAVDIAPTILEVAGAPIPDGMSGQSFLSILQHPEMPFRNQVFIQNNQHSIATRERALRTSRFLYIHNEYPRNIPQCMQLKGATGVAWAEFFTENKKRSRRSPEKVAFCFEKRPEHELYDVRQDPYQLHNLADNADFLEVSGEMEQLLLSTRRELGDPDMDFSNRELTEQFMGFLDQKQNRLQYLREYGEELPAYVELQGL